MTRKHTSLIHRVDAYIGITNIPPYAVFYRWSVHRTYQRLSQDSLTRLADTVRKLVYDDHGRASVYNDGWTWNDH